MSHLRITLLVFTWSIPVFLILCLSSLFFADEFLGIWILSPWDYPFSYAITLWVSISCAAILLTIFRPSVIAGNLSIVLLGLYIGFLLDIVFIVYLLSKIFNEFDENGLMIGALLYWIVVVIPVAFKHSLIIILIGILLILWKNKISVVATFTKILTLAIDRKTWLSLGIGIVFIFVPVLVPLILALFVGVRLARSNEILLSRQKRLLYLTPLLATFIIVFLGIAKLYPLPGLAIPTNIRHNWGTSAFNIYPDRPYEESIVKLRECKMLENEIGAIEKTALVEGKNDLIFPFWDEGLSAYLNIELVGKKNTAIARVYFFRKYRINKNKKEIEDWQKAKIYYLGSHKKIDISQCI